ncbi:MAG: hypothetical protein EOM25_13860, partial [Deltaproteobacteria bacterium]|nr:hypothetical protein [Deltaproteobacteria bacterium]
MDERLIRRQMQTKAGQDLPLVYLQLGQCIFTGDKMIISTVLGSCVGGTFFHAPTGLAAMFHSMLP